MIDRFTRNPYYHPHSYVYPNIYSKAKGDHSKITKDDVGNAMDIIAAYMMQDYRFDLVLDLAERNEALSPAKEMTIAEIEKELGYKIKIVKDQEE